MTSYANVFSNLSDNILFPSCRARISGLVFEGTTHYSPSHCGGRKCCGARRLKQNTTFRRLHEALNIETEPDGRGDGHWFNRSRARRGDRRRGDHDGRTDVVEPDTSQPSHA